MDNDGTRDRSFCALLSGLALIAMLLLASGCGGQSSSSEASAGGDGSGGKLALVAYSTPEEAYKELIPAFNRTAEGKGVKLQPVVRGVGRAVARRRGRPPGRRGRVLTRARHDAAGGRRPRRRELECERVQGMVTDSVVVFMVRKGNPKGIKDWDDLVPGDVEVLEPNPFTSGGAKWNIMAAYGAQLEKGKSPEEAQQYLAELFENVPVLDKSGRESLQTFSSGKGDVLLGYENEAILAQEKGEDIDYVVPDQTILIENPVAATSESKNPDVARSFVDFLYTEEAQTIFAEKGYRPVVEGTPGADEFPEPADLFDITRFGGWDKVNTDFFDPENGTVAKIFQDQGKSTASG